MDIISLAGLGMVMEKIEEGVLFLDEQQNIVAINSAAAHMVGRKHGDIVGTNCRILFPGTPCGLTCEGGGKCSLMVESAQGNKQVQDIVVARPDGMLVPLHMWATALPTGRIAGTGCNRVAQPYPRSAARGNGWAAFALG